MTVDEELAECGGPLVHLHHIPRTGEKRIDGGRARRVDSRKITAPDSTSDREGGREGRPDASAPSTRRIRGVGVINPNANKLSASIVEALIASPGSGRTDPAQCR